MNDVWLYLVDERRDGRHGHEGDAQALVGWPLERREAVNVQVARALPDGPRLFARRDHPHMMTATGEIERQFLCGCGHAADHRWVEIGDQQYTHVVMFSLARSGAIKRTVPSLSVGERSARAHQTAKGWRSCLREAFAGMASFRAPGAGRGRRVW